MKFDSSKAHWLITAGICAVLMMPHGCAVPHIPWINPAPTPAPSSPISIEPQYKTAAGYIVRVTAATTGKSVKWRVFFGPDPQPSLQVVDSHTVDFSSPKPGRFIIQASTSVNGESESADTVIVNGEPVPPGPQPPTPPGPGPSVGPLKVLMIYDSDPAKRKLYGPGQVAAMQGVKVLNYLKAHCAKGPDGKTPEWRAWPDNADPSKESASWQAAFARPRNGLPWIVISNGTPGGVFEGPLPGSDDDNLKLLQNYGGP